jgi:hypothetical protein
MALRSITMIALTMLGAAGCKSLDCADGTIERNGACQPADLSASNSQCGTGTHLEADKCIPDLPPTLCDPSTTVESTDDAGVTTCVGTGGGGCGATFACPNAGANKQTICGQIYDFEDMSPFQADNAVGAVCAPGATTGPCALTIKAFDAIAFAMGSTTELPHGTIYMDDCGRYRVPDIGAPGGPYVALGLDDTAAADAGPGGITNAAGVATPYTVNTSLNGFEAFIVRPATTASWQASGGPGIATGYYINVFRAHTTGFAPQAGVKAMKGSMVIGAANAFYFVDNEVTHDTVDVNQHSTGANGTVLITGAGVGDGVVYTGDTTVLPPECRWGLDPGATLPGVAFIQIKRPVNASGMTCGL